MDQTERLATAVQEAAANGARLTISGAGSKRTLLPAARGDILTTAEHVGVIAHDPAELVVTARAGTPLRALSAELAQHGQHLAADPPTFLGQGTVGGMVAAGLSGPGRPWSGAVRDAVLGVKLINGLGEVLTFGGQVMKNVAGYDVSRLVCGAYGALGVVAEVSLRVAPVFEEDLTVVFDLSAAEAQARCAGWRQCYLPLQGTWWCGGKLYVRLAGSAAGVAHAANQLGGERSNLPWDQIRDQTLDFFKPLSADSDRTNQTLYRVIVPPASPLPGDAADMALMWGGGLRWWWHDQAAQVEDYARSQGGWAWALGAAPPIDAGERKLMGRIKRAFDPKHVFATPLPIEADDAD